MTKPNFLIIGAAKSGTTALYKYLEQHPEICMSSTKEPNFFALEGEKLEFSGPDYYHIQRRTVTNWDDYQSLFSHCSEEKAIGEASWSSLYSPKACERIQAYCPDAKLLAVIRNPVDRAFAHFLYMVQYQRETLVDFESAIREEKSRIADSNWWFDWHYIQIGFYHKQLKRYFNRFDENKIKVYLHEDLLNARTQTVKSIFDFLEVNPDFVPNLSKKHNPTGVPKNKVLDRMVRISRQSLWLKKLIKSSPFSSAYGNLKTAAASLDNLNSFKPDLSPDLRSSLINIYRDDILQLQDLIQRDLSSWLDESVSQDNPA